MSSATPISVPVNDSGEYWKRIAPPTWPLRQLLALSGAGDGDVGDAVDAQPVHHSPLQLRGRVVQVNDGLVGAGDRLVGAFDQLRSALGEHLNPHVVGHQILLHELAAELEVRRRCRREADFDLLEAHLHQCLEHPPLARHVHRVDEGLVSVAQIHRAPQRRLGDVPVGPGAVRKVRRECVRAVQVERHRAGLLSADALDVCHGSLLRVRAEDCVRVGNAGWGWGSWGQANKKPPGQRRRRQGEDRSGPRLGEKEQPECGMRCGVRRDANHNSDLSKSNCTSRRALG